ncbi:MAG: low molecular weight protein-tyrosine-phosphatase [Prevotella sp.]|nr:low molecular weight phosphotyrosine protein phosphatase [Prevotella sp.]MDY3247060.1 low molecular weight protein-tyrosine-phosphatase [Prevotella sp.]
MMMKTDRTDTPAPLFMPCSMLFVCLGNICRSPAAQAVMEQMAERAGLADQITVDSAGVGDWHVGQLPDARMRRHGARRGYAVDHRARRFVPADFDRFDYIIVMDEGNYRAISAQARDDADRAKIVRMSSYLPADGRYDSVPDPYYGDGSDFELALDLIESACGRMLQAAKPRDNH